MTFSSLPRLQKNMQGLSGECQKFQQSINCSSDQRNIGFKRSRLSTQAWLSQKTKCLWILSRLQKSMSSQPWKTKLTSRYFQSLLTFTRSLYKTSQLWHAPSSTLSELIKYRPGQTRSRIMRSTTRRYWLLSEPQKSEDIFLKKQPIQ